MVYYIRFLKVPSIAPQTDNVHSTVKTAVTITTDLGDSFCASGLQLLVHLESSRGPHLDWKCQSTWKPGMRAIIVEALVITENFSGPLRLCVYVQTVSPASGNIVASIKDPPRGLIPAVVPCWSDTFDISRNRQAAKMVERRFMLDHDGACELHIWEETGESIARHIWYTRISTSLDRLAYGFRDAGLGLVAHINHMLQETPVDFKATSVLELGSGCGIAGIAVAQMLSGCKVTLTDLPVAMGILDRKVSEARIAAGSMLAKLELDWNNDVPHTIRDQCFDLILVSDCTYNPDSLPALVKTLSTLMLSSPNASVIVSMKVRDSSEAIFFTLMSDAAFEVVEHVAYNLPIVCPAKADQPREVIDIYKFRYQQPLVCVV